MRFDLLSWILGFVAGAGLATFIVGVLAHLEII